jgi:glutamyl-tRNA reductase
VSYAAALRALESIGDPVAARILVVGAGETAALAAQAFRRLGVNELAFVNRTFEGAEALAESWGGRALTWYMLDDALVWADAVICATGAPHTIISRQDAEAVMSRRQDRTLTIMDIAVPRDVEYTVRELAGVHYHDIDDLQNVVDANLELRKSAISQVDAIIEEEMLRFVEWHRGRQVLPVIKELREWVQDVAQEELEKTLHRLPDADDRTRQLVGRMVNQLVNRLLHEPTTRLRMQALKGNGFGYAYAVRELFDLHDLEGQIPVCDNSDCPLSLYDNATSCSLRCIVPAAVGSPE